MMTLSTTLYFFLHLLAIFSIVTSSSVQQNPINSPTCNHPPYKVHLFSKAPLVVYLEGFLTPEERSHLQEVTYVLGSCSSPLLFSTFRSNIWKVKAHSPSRLWQMHREKKGSGILALPDQLLLLAMSLFDVSSLELWTSKASTYHPRI